MSREGLYALHLNARNIITILKKIGNMETKIYGPDKQFVQISKE